MGYKTIAKQLVVFYPKDERVRATLTYFGEGREFFLYSTMSLAKPAMRGLLGKRLRFHLPIAFALSLVAAAAFKYGLANKPLLHPIVHS
ncbi:hypothetical protein J4Q44_G00088340 [Coregonus suidteri]|uniref:Uncharacterized protein n=1 Tax=Coregonus suidteri TaxID=861788 RepID=A0AAN8R3D5_9TELE